MVNFTEAFLYNHADVSAFFLYTAQYSTINVAYSWTSLWSFIKSMNIILVLMYPPLSLTKSFNNHLADISMVVTVHCDLGQLRNLIEDPDINVHFLFPFFRQQRSLWILLKLSSASTLMSAFFSFLSSVNSSPSGS